MIFRRKVAQRCIEMYENIHRIWIFQKFSEKIEHFFHCLHLACSSYTEHGYFRGLDRSLGSIELSLSFEIYNWTVENKSLSLVS